MIKGLKIVNITFVKKKCNDTLDILIQILQK